MPWIVIFFYILTILKHLSNVLRINLVKHRYSNRMLRKIFLFLVNPLTQLCVL